VKYQCVEIIAGTKACAAAKSLKNVRLLSAEAPVLPLSTCETPADCQCVYVHFNDRRHRPRREDEHVTRAIPYTHDERRIGRGRRATDCD
jgi:hypothetical protein